MWKFVGRVLFVTVQLMAVYYCLRRDADFFYQGF